MTPQDWRVDRELPRDIVEKIYRTSCCRDTPEEAQKEPCACIATHIVEVIEEWGNGYIKCDGCGGNGGKRHGNGEDWIYCQQCDGNGCIDESLRYNG